MTNIVNGGLPYLALIANILIVVSVAAILYRTTFGKDIAHFLGKYARELGLVVSLTGFLGSVFYSSIMGYTPCYLCWWQRILIFPQIILFTVALTKRDRGVFRYVVPMAVIASFVSVYHSFIQLSGYSPLPCDAAASCTKVYVLAFSYITIPFMALTISVMLLILAWANKVYEDSHA